MTKRKSVVSKLLLLVALMTLVSCCFLGSTFARYISTGTGTATIPVAKWAINVGDTGSGAAQFKKLSPLMKKYEGTARANPSGKILVASMSNAGDVDALVKFTIDDVVIASDAAYGTQGVAVDGIPTADEVKAVFSVKFYYATSNDADAATNEITDEGITLNAAGGEMTAIYIFAEATWTSDTGTITGDTADLRDTYIGQYVSNVVYNYTWEAAQATELP